ncbi:Ufe1 protein [Starmerella bacillaris]|uniref:Ufe1 protein n=1 Tax=Starmerella bacillaris TaxID=1247836 RepID=A0AAV5RIS7_STABA|nr:Ufe1 protein [Starmerella bacillaris]
MDRTILYRELVRLAGQVEVGDSQSDANKLDPVTTECSDIAMRTYNVLNSIKQIRPSYLDIQAPRKLRSKDREEFDYSVRKLLQVEQKRVRTLEEREYTRSQDLEHKNHSILNFWDNPESIRASKMLSLHRQGMFYCLNILLQRVSKSLAELQEIQQARDIPYNINHKDIDLGFGKSQELDPIQEKSISSETDAVCHSLLEEHDDFLNELSYKLDQATQAEKSMREISELQMKLNQHLVEQSGQLEIMSLEAVNTENNVDRANNELERAKRSNRRSSLIIIYSSLITGLFLLLLNGK